jgi:predicted Zn-dependent protease with MMP-like domain
MTTPADFDRLVRLAADTVGAAQRQLPPEIRTLARGVAVHYERLPDLGILAEGFEPDILGLFTGNPHGVELSDAPPAPPQILLYLENLWDFADGEDDIFRDEVRVTYLHELGHYLGWDEDELTARGLD